MRPLVKERTASRAARQRRLLLQRALPVAVLGLGIFAMPVMLISEGGLSRLDSLAEERETVKLEISRLTKRIDHLSARADGMKNDPAAVERAARDQLGLVRRTEVVFHFREKNER